MTATVEHVLAEVKALPHAELRELWQEVNQLMAKLYGNSLPPLTPRQPEQIQAAWAALNALDGKFAGDGLLQRLLEERAHDRQREQAELATYLERHSLSRHA